MPIHATSAAPVSAPSTRAASALLRSIPSAPISQGAGMVAPISALRMPKSDGRTRPDRKATARTAAMVSVPVNASAASSAASTA